MPTPKRRTWWRRGPTGSGLGRPVRREERPHEAGASPDGLGDSLVTDRPPGRQHRGRGWVSAVTAARAAATRWPPTSHPVARAGSKGKGRTIWTPGAVRGTEICPCSSGSLSTPRSRHVESDRPRKERSSGTSGKRLDRPRPRPHACAVSLTGTLSLAPAEPFWRGTAR